MARITHVKKAQQRFRTIPVLDEFDRPTYTTVNRTRPTKRGKTSFQKRVTVEDRTQPLPPETCDHCRAPIEVGTPYKWVKTKSTYGGVRRTRHESCPTWQPWDLSSAAWARVAQIQHQHYISDDAEFDSAEDALSLLEDAASEAEDLASEKEEAADNLESGFGHETEQSAQIRETADNLREWGESLTQVDLDEKPEREEDQTDDEYEQAVADWRDSVISALNDALNESPEV